MEHIFINLAETLEESSTRLFRVLGIQDVKEGESSNVLGGVYFSAKVFGCEIKLEYNSYDYEDKYRYMITVKEDLLSNVTTDGEVIHWLALLIVRVVIKNLQTEVAHEFSNKLEVFLHDKE